MAHHTTLWWARAARGVATPTAPVRGAVTQSTATLTWEIGPGNVNRLQRSTDTATWTVVYEGSQGTFTDTGLAATSTYYYRLVVIHGEETSSPSAVVSVVTASSPQPPATPDVPISSGLTSTSVTWSWDAVPGATAYLLEQSANGTTGWTQAYSGSGLTTTKTGLASATPFYFRLTASNADGSSSPSTVVSVTTLAVVSAPANPTAAPTVSSKTSASVTLSLGAVATATGYVVQIAAATGTTWTTVFDGADADLSVTDSGLDASTTYRYRYAAKNSGGQSPGWSPTVTVTTDSATGTMVQPLSAKACRDKVRVVVHQNFDGVYQEVDLVKEFIDSMGFTGIRTQWQESRATTADYLQMCVDLGLKVNVPAQTAGLTASERAVRNGIKWWSDNAPDQIESFEGINEPSNYTGLAYPAWQDAVMTWQTIIADEVHKYANLSHVKVVSSAMHEGDALDAVAVKKNWWQELADKGLGDLCDVMALHTYPYSDPPDGGGSGYDLDGRIRLISDAFPGKPIWITESGYSSQWPNTDGIYGTAYGGRFPLEMVRRNRRYHHYELFDDRAGDPGSTGVQKDFGLVSVTATRTGWALKTLGTSLKNVVDEWREPLDTANYTPTRVRCDIATTGTDIRSVVTATKAQSDLGTATLFLYRGATAGATATTVTVTDGVGDRDYSVNANVTKLTLRAPR
jgi:hypothetical protein